MPTTSSSTEAIGRTADQVAGNGTEPLAPAVVVVGEALIDLLVDEDPRHPTAWPGGSPANTAISLARLGTAVAFAGRFGNDRFGDLLLANLAANGVDLRHVVEAAEPTSLAIVTRGPDGAASYGFHVAGAADWCWSARELADLTPGRLAVHVGSLAVAMEPGAGLLADWFRGQRDRCVTSLDPNVRPALVGPRERYRPRLEALVASSDIVKVSAEDLAWVYPDDDPLTIAERWRRDLGPALVVVTFGADGVAAVHSGPSVRRAAVQVSVVDTVGAGDAFTGGLLHWLAEHGRLDRARLADLPAEELARALDFASTAAAIACTRPGADPPHVGELLTPSRSSDHAVRPIP